MSTQDLKFEESRKSQNESIVNVYRDGNGTQSDWIIALSVFYTGGEEIDQFSVEFPLHTRARLKSQLPPDYSEDEIMAAVTKYVEQKYEDRLEHGDGATPQDFVPRYTGYHPIVIEDLPKDAE